MGNSAFTSWYVQPPLLLINDYLGMLIAGIAIRNVPLISGLVVPMKWSSVLRKAAFVVILLRGGLSLDGEALKKMKALDLHCLRWLSDSSQGACIRLALCPCTVEAVVVALAAKLIFGISILFGLLLGWAITSIIVITQKGTLLNFLSPDFFSLPFLLQSSSLRWSESQKMVSSLLDPHLQYPFQDTVVVSHHSS